MDQKCPLRAYLIVIKIVFSKISSKIVIQVQKFIITTITGLLIFTNPAHNRPLPYIFDFLQPGQSQNQFQDSPPLNNDNPSDEKKLSLWKQNFDTVHLLRVLED